VHAVLLGIYSPDLPDPDPVAYQPPDPECFSLTIGAFIAPSEPPPAQDELQLRVCTASWLDAHPPPKGFEFLRGTILLPRWDYAILRRAIDDLCRHAQAATWDEIARRLNCEGRW
jgi:hypothetical protein